MIVTVRFEGHNLRFEKTVALDALPDYGDEVLVKPVGDWVTMFGDEPVRGRVTERSFVEADFDNVPEVFRSTATTMQCILDVKQA